MSKIYNRLSWLERLFFLTCILVATAGTAQAVRVSGPGQTTAARSLSVAVASDQSAIATKTGVTKVTAVTASAFTDLSSFCQDGLRIGASTDGGLAVAMTGMDAGVTDAGAQTVVTMSGVAANTFIPGSFSYVVPTGTSVSDIKCFGH